MNFRRDCWASALEERDWWNIYHKTRRAQNWTDAVKWIEDNYAVRVCKTSYYDFMKEMGKQAALDRVVKLRAKREEAERISEEAKLDDATTRNTLLCLANDAALEGDSSQSVQYANAAVAVWTRMLAEQELKLRQQAQQTKDDALKLAREKFEAAERRLNAAKDAFENETLTEEQRREKLREIFGYKAD